MAKRRHTIEQFRASTRKAAILFAKRFGGPTLSLRNLLSGLGVTLLIRADEICIRQHVALHCSLDLRFRRTL
jgi:hypothetical protein